MGEGAVYQLWWRGRWRGPRWGRNVPLPRLSNPVVFVPVYALQVVFVYMLKYAVAVQDAPCNGSPRTCGAEHPSIVLSISHQITTSTRIRSPQDRRYLNYTSFVLGFCSPKKENEATSYYDTVCTVQLYPLRPSPSPWATQSSPAQRWTLSISCLSSSSHLPTTLPL